MLSAPPLPQASLRRLPQYHHYLIDLEVNGARQVSCSMIGRDLNLVPVQVRKDLQYTGIVGKPKTGYAIRELIESIENFLGWNKVNEAFLIGAGNLGTALLGHERFSRFGLRIVAAFDGQSARQPVIFGQEFRLGAQSLRDQQGRRDVGRLGELLEQCHELALE